MRLDESKSIALKVDVDTLRGTLEGVPALLELFQRYNIKATFLFSVGPDNTGRALKRIFRPGFFSKVKRTSVIEHYGLKTLLYGVLLPAPFIADHAKRVMASAVEQGHDVGIHCYDHVLWQDYVRHKSEEWTRRQMQLAYDAYVECIGATPSTIGAAGWQLNDYVPKIESDMGFRYASDTRGDTPFYPALDNVKGLCLQIPTTLPTLDELLGVGSINESNIAGEIVELCGQTRNQYGHVFTLHAELEGMKLLQVMDQLIQLWMQDDFKLVCLEQRFQSLTDHILPRQKLSWKKIPGRSGEVATSV